MSEQIIKELVELSYEKMLEKINLDSDYNDVYIKNNDIIYIRKIQKNFECIKNNQDLYLILKESKAYNNFCIQKSIKKCDNLDEYFNRAFDYMYETIQLEFVRVIYKINVLTNIYNCNKNIKNIDTWWYICKQILIEKNNSEHWKKFKDTIGNSLLLIAEKQHGITRNDVLEMINEEREQWMRFEE